MTSTPISYPFSFPLCDQLICEFDDAAALLPVGFPTEPRKIVPITSYSGTLPRSVQRVSRVAQYIYQKVVSRKPVPYLPSQKNPKYILCTIEETLECGHKVTVYPSELETLTARTRNCHECSGWFGGLKLPDLKKPVASIKNAVRRNGTEGAGYWWPIVFALLMCLLFAYLGHHAATNEYTYQAPDDIYRVLNRFDATHYRFNWVHRQNGQLQFVRPMRINTCTDGRLSAGQTITWVHFVLQGDCWNIEGSGLGYQLETSDGRTPSLSSNCHPGPVIVECAPNLTEAIFPKEN